MRDAQVVRVLREIVRRYDVLLLQEVVDNSGEAVQELLEAVNEAEGEDAYGLEVSPRLGRSNAKEQYAFFYRKRRFTLARGVFNSPVSDLDLINLQIEMRIGALIWTLIPHLKPINNGPL